MADVKPDLGEPINLKLKAGATGSRLRGSLQMPNENFRYYTMRIPPGCFS